MRNYLREQQHQHQQQATLGQRGGAKLPSSNADTSNGFIGRRSTDKLHVLRVWRTIIIIAKERRVAMEKPIY